MYVNNLTDPRNEAHAQNGSATIARFLLRDVRHVRGGRRNPPHHGGAPQAEEVPAPRLHVLPQGDADQDRVGRAPAVRGAPASAAGQAGH